jgi:hypothetical protein
MCLNLHLARVSAADRKFDFGSIRTALSHHPLIWEKLDIGIYVEFELEYGWCGSRAIVGNRMCQSIYCPLQIYIFL